MKIRLCLLSSALCLAVLAGGCGGKESEKKSAEAPKEPAKIVSVAEAKAPVDYEKAYDPVLKGIIDRIARGDDGTEIADEHMGFLEYSRYTGYSAAYNNIGYALKDISGDGLPELILASVDGPKDSTMIYSLYSLVNSKPHLLFHGHYRNAHYLLDNNEIYNTGSGGAAISIFGTYTIDFNGSGMHCNSYYFTDANPADMSKIEFFKNSFGKFDKSISEKISEGTFESTQNKFTSRIVHVPVTPLAKYVARNNAQQPEISFDIRPAQAVVGDVSDFVRHDATGGPDSVEIAIVFNYPLKNFKLNKLTFVDKGDGKLHFDTQTLYSSAVMRIPFVSRVSIPGTIPAYGISFVDEKGDFHQFAISQSGEDGRLLLEKY